MSHQIPVVYVTSSLAKREESSIFLLNNTFSDGVIVGDVFSFDLRSVVVNERLEVDLKLMVEAEVVDAYLQLKVPCIVEHAGLVFEGYDHYPGGLTKPMWNILGDRFLDETLSRNRRATARAVVAFCDGMKVYSFTGETPGTLATELRGSRAFYWDTVFVPDEGPGLTYAEIADDPDYGLVYKMSGLSQSSRAMLKFFEHFRSSPRSWLWST